MPFASRPTTGLVLTTLLAVSTSLGGCMAIANPNGKTAANAAEEWVGGPVDLRKMTAIVRVAPPARLVAGMARFASQTSDPDLADFLRLQTSSSFGSGFLIVRRGPEGVATFVVTNRHVIADAEDAEITFSDGATYKNCEIVYVDPQNDLAVLALPEAGSRAFPYGLSPTAQAPHDRQTIIATGYPTLAGRPSFQTTDGKISNARFDAAEGKEKPLALIQHTAPIDPGRSGGPLTGETGELVGVNVAVVRQRQAMNLAVPASAVVDAVRAAYEIKFHRTSAPWMTSRLESACLRFAAEFSSEHGDAEEAMGFVSNRLVAERGLESLARASAGAVGSTVWRTFASDPILGMRLGLYYQLLVNAHGGDGVLATNTCKTLNASDASEIANGHAVRIRLQTGRGWLELTWAFEHGSWRIADSDLLDRPAQPANAPTTKAAKTVKTTTKTSLKGGR